VSGPRPPADLAARRPEIVRLVASTVVHRFYAKGRNPVYFDRSSLGRFNAPDGSFGVLYVADAAHGAFAETFLRSPGRTLLDVGLLGDKAYVTLRLVSDVTLIRLTGPGLAKLGATAEVAHGGLPYDVSQIWSKALWESFANAHGIAYRARHDDEALCYALYDRAAAVVREAQRRTDLDQDWFWQIAQRCNVGLAP
jgi:hypothetical protein